MNENDKQIKTLMAQVDEKEKNLGKKVRHPLLTNGVFKYEDGKHFNINTISDVKKIVGALALIISKETAFKKACKTLNVKEKFEWNGYSSYDWEMDFKDRIAVIEWNKRKKDLEDAKKRLNELISSEGKTTMAIDEIKAMLESK